MAIFTDEDLKRLKENATKREGMLSTVCTVDATEVKALLTRLEAAEKVVACHILLEREWMRCSGTTTMINYDSFMSNLKAWREVAGKQPKGQNAT